MGGQTGVMSTWVSFLLFPHPFVCCGGVAGWNITPEVMDEFRHTVGS